MSIERRAFLCALGVVACARTACAQEAETLAARRDLIDRATQARDVGDDAHALDFAERASRLAMSPSLRFFIAEEQHALGQLAASYGNADQCARDAAIDPLVRNRETLVASCRALADLLRDQIARVTVRVPANAPVGVRVRVNGAELPDALWNVPTVVTPGSVALDVAWPGRASSHQLVRVRPRQTVEIALGTATVTHHAPSPRATAGPAPWILLATGAVGLVTAGIAFTLWNTALVHCPNGACPDQSSIDRVYNYGTVTYVALGAGAIASGAAIAWLLAARRGAPRVDVTALVSPTGATAALRVAF